VVQTQTWDILPRGCSGGRRAVLGRRGAAAFSMEEAGDQRPHVDLAELPEALRKAGRPGPKPKREPPERGTMPS